MRLAILGLALATAGCSSQYMPRSPHHVAMTMRDGKLVYVRDGQSFDAGLGGGLVDAVQGNPAASAAANEFRDHNVYGLTSALLGVGAMVGGAAWLGALAASDAGASNQQLSGPLLLTFVGVVAAMAGSLYAMSGQPYQWDAINLFNDSADAGFAPPTRAASFALPRPAEPSLRMRE